MLRIISLFLIAVSISSAEARTPVTRFTAHVTSRGPVVYYGGPVISKVKIFAVFWGKNVDHNVLANIGGFYAALSDSTYLDFLKQYSTKDQSIGRGTYTGSKIITPKNNLKTLSQADVEAEILYQLDQNILPKPDANTLFMIHFPPGISISAFGGASCRTWCADHEGMKNVKYGNFAYAMMPDLGGACSFGCGGKGNFNNMTVCASHEIAEAITDPLSPAYQQKPAFPAAWLSADENEIGDLCVRGDSTLKAQSATYAIQDEWDNSTNQCKSGAFISSL